MGETKVKISVSDSSGNLMYECCSLHLQENDLSASPLSALITELKFAKTRINDYLTTLVEKETINSNDKGMVVCEAIISNKLSDYKKNLDSRKAHNYSTGIGISEVFLSYVILSHFFSP